MKGLLIKDFKLLKNQRQFFAVIAAISVLCMFTYNNVSFAISYMTIVFSIFTLSTISYDEYDNGMAYLFTLPFSREEYVREKYVFGILLTAGALAAVSVLNFFIFLFKNASFEIGEWLTGVGVSFLVSVLILALTIPLQLKFGAERSRIAMIGVIGCWVLVIYLAVIFARIIGINIKEIFDRLAVNRPAVLIGGCCLVIALAEMVSYQMSLRVMKKKQF